VTGEMRIDPGAKDVKTARSLHVLGFSSVGELVLVESEGIFNFEEWENVEALARAACLSGVGEIGDIKMQDGEVEAAGKSLLDVLRGAVEARVVADERWRGG
jgi:exosome complex component RRP46